MAETPARGSDANYCSAYPAEGHQMVAHSGGKLIPWIEICSMCGWIDTALLDRYAEDAIKASLSERAGRIAVSAETQPFAFVQPSSGILDLREILTQALGAAYAAGQDDAEGRLVDATRLQQILDRLQGEVEREINLKRESS